MSYHIVSLDEMRSFITRAMEAVGTDSSHARTLADVLVMGDYRGHFSHGLNRLGISINSYFTGLMTIFFQSSIYKTSLPNRVVQMESPQS